MIILPLPAILWQILVLTIAIAIESLILHKKLYLSRRTSIEYAAFLNLFSTIFGWEIFFLAHPLLPLWLQQQIINFILFGNFATHLEFYSIRIYLYLVAFILFTFLLIFSIERLSLDFLLNFSELTLNLPSKQEASGNVDRQSSKRKQSQTRAAALNKTKSHTILLANASSQGLILLILLILERF